MTEPIDNWQREIVVNTLGRRQKDGGQPPNFDDLQAATGVGQSDLAETLAALKDDGSITEQQGRFVLDEEIADTVPDAGPPDEPPAVQEFLDGGDSEELADRAEPHEVAGPDLPPLLPRLEMPTPAAQVKLTPGMLRAIDDAGLGALVKAGVADASPGPFVLVIE